MIGNPESGWDLSKGVIPWSFFKPVIEQIERGSPNKRVVLVIVPSEDFPELFIGTYGSCPVRKGEAKIQWNSGDVQDIR